MMKTFHYTTYTPGIRTIVEVKKSMELLEEELKGTDLENLIAFNHTYWVITKNVMQKIGQNYFNDDLLMQRFDICFGYYYFNALKNYVNKKPIVDSWKILFDNCKKNHLFQFAYMALGVNAHVNNDIAFALRDTIHNKEYKQDYDKINTIIANSLKEVVTFLQENGTMINNTKNLLLPLYAFILIFIIKKWRNNAWNNYLVLQKNIQYDKRIETHASKFARFFSKWYKIKL